MPASAYAFSIVFALDEPPFIERESEHYPEISFLYQVIIGCTALAEFKRKVHHRLVVGITYFQFPDRYSETESNGHITYLCVVIEQKVRVRVMEAHAVVQPLEIIPFISSAIGRILHTHGKPVAVGKVARLAKRGEFAPVLHGIIHPEQPF